MTSLKITTVITCLVLLIGCHGSLTDSEPTTSKRWMKGNLHTHSYWSDGDEFPEVIVDWYKSNGYQFIALSDHNILAQGEKWVVISEDSLYQNAFNYYLQHYGPDWVEHRTDSGRLQVKLKTYDEYKERYEAKGSFLIIQSEEITDHFEDKPVHLNATNIQEKIDPQGGRSVTEVLQNNIDEVLRQRRARGVPILPHINHPNFQYGISLEDMVALRDERFFEVYNGHASVHNQGDSVHMSTEEMWDRINLAYLNKNQPVMYGLATDDSHHYHVSGSKWSNAGRGWIMVEADSLTPESLIAAMEAGNFYASTGVVLEELEVDENQLEVKVAPESGITYVISFIGCRIGQSSPEVFQSFTGTEASFEITDDILFVRCKIISSKLHSNPIEDILYEMAWTQPVVLNN